MGFMDKLKSAKNFVTGGGAEVQVSVEGASLTQPFTVNVSARATEGEMQISRCYVQIRANERATVRKVETQTGKRDVHADENTCKIDIDICGAGTLTTEGAQFSGQVTLPPGSLPTYNGRNAQHVYKVCAFLDKSGNDPDSGWQVFEVY